MAQHARIETHPSGAQLSHFAPLAASVTVGGAAFNEAELSAMTAILDEVCFELSKPASPQEREFVAWLVVRLSRNGVCDPDKVKQAVLEAMESGRRPSLRE